MSAMAKAKKTAATRAAAKTPKTTKAAAKTVKPSKPPMTAKPPKAAAATKIAKTAAAAAKTAKAPKQAAAAAKTAETAAARTGTTRRYWLMKSEPGVFSIDDLARAPGQTTGWEGVRNYQARNFLREARAGDGVLFWHSGTAEPGVAGTAVVAREAYPDPTQFDPRSEYHDPGSPADDPRWVAVDLRLERVYPRVIPLGDLRETPGLAEMVVLRRGNRLSVTPVTPAEWRLVERLAGRAPCSFRTPPRQGTGAARTARR